MIDEEKMTLQMNRNVRLSPWVIALAWDPVFIWTISTMYLSQVKGFSYSKIVLLESLLMLFGAVFCLPCVKIFEKVSPIKTIRIGLIGYVAFLLFYIYGTQYYTFIIAQVFLAFGYASCGIKSNSFTNDTLTLLKRGRDYNKIFGFGMSLVYIIECLGAIFITYVYNYNPVLAIWISVAIVGIAELITFFTYDTQKYMPRNVLVEAEIKVATKPRGNRNKNMIRFVIWLLIFSFMMRAITSVTVSLYKIYLQQIQTEKFIRPWMFGYLFAICRLFMAFGSNYQCKLNLKYGTLSIVLLSTALVFLFLIIGVLQLLETTYILVAILVILMSSLCAIRMPLQILTSNYVNKFVSKNKIDRIFSAKMMVEYVGYTVGGILYSALLVLYNDWLGLTNLTFILILLIPFVIATIFLLKYLFKVFNKKQTIIKKEYTEE